MHASIFPEDSLNYALQKLASDYLPDALPLVHTTTLERLKNIINEKSLILSQCEIFNQDLLYFFYGGPFYRPKAPEFENSISSLPVSLMLKPSILKEATCFYPYDTGAASNGFYGEDWSSVLGAFEKFKMNGDESFLAPKKFIRYIYGDNQSYFDGELIETYKDLPHPIPTVCDFYTDMKKMWVTSRTPDIRRSKIECHFDKPIPLANNVLWIAVPSLNQKKYIEYKTALKCDLPSTVGVDKPKFYWYPWNGDLDGEGIVKQLEAQAIEYLRDLDYLPKP